MIENFLDCNDPYLKYKGYYKVEKYTGNKIYGSVVDFE